MPTRTYHVSKVIEAPLSYVYDWCTDFREDDWKIAGSSIRRRILEKNERRVIYTVSYVEDGKERGHVSVVTLNPPNSWHLQTAGDEEEQETADYKLTRFGRNKTRLDMIFKMKYGESVRKIPTAKKLADDLSKFWDKLVIGLSQDYLSRTSSRTEG